MALRPNVFPTGGGGAVAAAAGGGVIPIPYPAAIGTVVTGSPFDISAVWAGVGNEDRYLEVTGAAAWLFMRNDSDSLLLLLWPSSNEPCFIHPGEALTEPIPRDETSFKLSVIAQNPFQTHPLQVLTVLGYNRRDIANGHILVQSATVNPSVPAAAIGPGTLPPGVIVPDAQQVDATHSGATAVPQVVASSASGLNTSDQVAVFGYLAVFPTANDGQARGTGFGRIDAGGTLHFGECFEDATGAWNAVVLFILGGPSGSKGKIDFESPFMVYRTPQSGATPFAHILQSYDGVASHNALGVGSAAAGSGQTNVGDTGALLTVAGQATAGSFGVPPIIAESGLLHVTDTSAHTLISITLPADGKYRVSATYESHNSATATPKMQTNFTDANNGADHVNSPASNLAGGVGGKDVYSDMDGATVSIGAAFGTDSVLPVTFWAKAAALTVVFQEVGGGTVSDFVSATLERLA